MREIVGTTSILIQVAQLCAILFSEQNSDIAHYLVGCPEKFISKTKEEEMGICSDRNWFQNAGHFGD